MKKILIFVLILACAVSLSSCIAQAPDKPKYAYTVSYANWSDDVAIVEGALNKEIIESEGGAHLPVFKMDTLQELEQFKAQYGDILSMNQGYNEVLSFEETLSKAQFDRESFFKDNTLLIVYVMANSGSLRFCLGDVRIAEKSVSVYVEQANDPKIHTDDMAGWFILVEIDDKEIADFERFDAILAKK